MLTGPPMSNEEQLRLWVEGSSIHGDECVPDFSCCRPHLLQPIEVRIAFVSAGEKERAGLLYSFLGALLADAGLGDRVHMAGKDPDDMA